MPSNLGKIEYEWTLGREVLKWIVTYLVQPNGPDAGKPFRPTPEQVQWLKDFYAINADGSWVVDRGTWRGSKNTGKTPWSAAQCAVEFLGPVRFGGWDKDGQPIAVPAEMPLVVVAANTEKQSKNIMTMIQAMMPAKGKARAAYGLEVHRTQINYERKNGQLYIASNSPGSLEGHRFTAAFISETEHMTSGNGGPALMEALARNVAKTDGRVVEDCNAYIPGLGTVAEDSQTEWERRQLIPEEKDTRLYHAPEMPADTDIKDPESLRAGLAVAYAGAPWVNLDRVVREFRGGPVSQSRRFWGNQIVAQDSSWTSRQAWDALIDKEAALKPGDEIVLGFDGSNLMSEDPFRDATALVACRISDGYVQLLGLAVYGDNQGPAAVDGWLAKAFDLYNVRAFFADVREWEERVYTVWPDEYGDELTVKATPGGKHPSPIAWDMRVKKFDMTRAYERVEAEITNGMFHHNGDERLSQHVYNAARMPNRFGVSISKDSPNSPRKIDAAVAMVVAREARYVLLNDPAWLKAQKRVDYSDQRMLSYSF